MTFWRRRARIALAAVPLALGCAVAAGAAEVTIPPSHDNSIFEGTDNRSCGVGPLFAGQTGGFGARRALISFDIAGSLPAGSTVTSVDLGVTVEGSGPGASAADVYSLYRLQADWGEENSPCDTGVGGLAETGDATWSDRHYPTDAWLKPGGDFASSASGSAAMATLGPSSVPSQAGMVADVQSWLDQPSGNYGWIIVGAEAVSRSAREFDSREGAAPPSLHVVFTPPPVPPPAVPDGIAGSPVLLGKLSADGADLSVSWDAASCDGDVGHHIVFGTLSGFPATVADPYTLAGSVCGLGASGPAVWSGSPDPAAIDPVHRMIWLLVLANDGATTEGSWGRSSSSTERNGSGADGCSGQCGILDKSVTNTCGNGF
jgi:hypothetical protein